MQNLPLTRGFQIFHDTFKLFDISIKIRYGRFVIYHNIHDKPLTHFIRLGKNILIEIQNIF